MKYFIISEAGQAIECHCISGRYLASAIETLPPMEGYPVQPVPWLRDVDARDPGGLKSQFMRSANARKRQCRQQSESPESAYCDLARVGCDAGRHLPQRNQNPKLEPFRAARRQMGRMPSSALNGH